MDAEFDRFSVDYAELLHDPIREKFAPNSHFFHERKWALLQNWARRLRIDLHRESWVDLGCGKGELLRLGRPHVGRALGCDLSEGMLQSCADLEIRLQESPDRLPFDDGSIGLATAVCVYHHVAPEDRPALTAEVRRVLRPGGIFFIIEHNPLNPVTKLIVSRTPVDADALLLTDGSARRVMRRGGFEVLGTQYFLYFPEPMYRRLGRAECWLARVPLGGQYAVLGRKQE